MEDFFAILETCIMSSRALRKLQRDRDTKLTGQENDNSNGHDSSADEQAVAPTLHVNPFDLVIHYLSSFVSCKLFERALKHIPNILTGIPV